MTTTLLPRDAELLVAVGRYRMLSRPQVKRLLFPEVDEAVVTRAIARLTKRGCLGSKRLHGNGVQILWLTKKGFETLRTSGRDAQDLFPASGPAAAKDFEHTRAIGDVAVWLSAVRPAPHEILAAWCLQRLFGSRLTTIPDLLALWRSENNGPSAALAIEVDLGTEPVLSVLIPKLRALRSTLDTWLAGSIALIVVVVPSPRRAESIRRAAKSAGVTVAVNLFADLAVPSTRPSRRVDGET